MSDIFEEVDEEVRRDKAAEFWKKYQNHILAVAVLIVVAASGFRYYEYRRTQASEAAGAAFQQALELEQAGKSAEASAALTQLASDAPSGYRLLARFAAAAAKSKTDAPGAIAAYDALAQDGSGGPLFQDAARLRAALLRLDAGETDKARTALEALAGSGGTYRHTARLMLGVAALSAKDYDAAGKWLDQAVADADAPQNVRQNANLLLGLVASDRPATK